MSNGYEKVCNNSVVAVIGKRDSDGRKLCISERIGKTISQSGYIVLNGLAVGCDEYAIKGAVFCWWEGDSCYTRFMPGKLDRVVT